MTKKNIYLVQKQCSLKRLPKYKRYEAYTLQQQVQPGGGVRALPNAVRVFSCINGKTLTTL